MQFHEVLSRFPYLLLRLALKPQEALKLPAQNKGNTLRGAFGSSFRRLVCVPECRNAQSCPLAESCPYKLIFEPSPPLGSDRLSKNQDIPRPFIFRPPLDSKTTYETGEIFAFELVLLGTAVNYLPYFVLAFREVVANGFGLNRARCELTDVRTVQVTGDSEEGIGNREQGTDYREQITGESEKGSGLREQVTGNREQTAAADPVLSSDSVPSSLSPVTYSLLPIPSSLSPVPCNLSPVSSSLFPVTYNLSPVTCNLIYSSADQVFHQPQVSMLADYIRARLAQFPVPYNLSPVPYNLSPVTSRLSPVPCNLFPASALVTRHSPLVTVSFLSPTHLCADGQRVREPEFHHLFKRLRDRLNALSTFYGPGPIDADFKGLGELAEKVLTAKRNVHWVERYRTSSKTHQRHELSGFVGSCIYEFAGVVCPLPAGGGLQAEGQVTTASEPHSREMRGDLQSEIPNPDALSVFLPWLLAGEICHVGKHATWGNGRVQCD